MKQQEFQQLSTSRVADIVQQEGPIVCGFPFNGTRRWFMLEHPVPDENPLSAYVNAITDRLLEIIRLLFEHGIDTILMPMLSPYLFDSRGSEYTNVMLEALTILTDKPSFLNFYESFGVRVRFYGDYARYLSGTPFAHLINKFDALAEETDDHATHRLFWGICAHDATKTTASLAVQYFQQFGQEPDRRSLIEMYYGEHIPNVNLFISASKLRLFDIPLLTTGREDLYFTVAPSPYLSKHQLREILFDHLFARQKDHARYDAMQPGDWADLRAFYHANLDNTIGIGEKRKEWGLWIPFPPAKVPNGANHEN